MSMGMTGLRLAAGALAIALASSGAHAASDYLMKLDGVKGEASAGTIEVQSFSWGAHNAGSSASSGGMAQGRAAAASPPAGPGTVLVTAAAESSCPKGKHFATVVLTGRGTSYALSDATVTECSVHGDPHVMELSYGKVSVSDLSITSGPRNRTAPLPSSGDVAPAPSR